ncbi:hypothetical protein, conserved in Apicomplexan species [Plasmodium knowlesi strain H]|uniref:Uncharacterized protein n=3 Tax=Plasmodium knowlesi TaxID=5850 RepID=A0A5K1UCR3_PLAKH|nr:uncharacterized protein PKNH_1466200 [Plasmodium knowlesi strain H]OTN64056.1 Uncharacterized protein PKNOH_S140284900 [Plasmodium knowlesi]CAA9991259.1 methyltransferase, putative [Plasmodium knowlesi strain H]SBO26341.1 hypothetical protein, conserved in Apicomplexan species [Plasmodium knowlesi strain H]SBO29034.1 hypothetical protein, conserved in Apicomplexan species [Plasmodium knowlesi strain H]VVS80733.1 methyltransferase, putative [Plasmodium knowlesi strain H]|eukprot:XP_002262538.1 [Plasmodium knowlesi strain H]
MAKVRFNRQSYRQQGLAHARFFSHARFFARARFFAHAKFEKNTKFGEELLKYHHEQYVDKAHRRPDLYLKGNENKHAHDNRLRRNIPFVYSNEVKNLAELKGNPFTLVNVKNENDESFGVATFNPYSLITARIISTNALFSVNVNFFVERLKKALAWRSKMVEGGKRVNWGGGLSTNEASKSGVAPTGGIPSKDTAISPIGEIPPNQNYPLSEVPLLPSDTSYRLINGEGDNIPGLIIDRYHDYVSIQHLTLGMELLAATINEAVMEVLNPKVILFRNDNKERLNERLHIYKKIVHGKLPEQVILKENNCFFFIDMLNSPNTGWFHNRRHLRQLISDYAYDKKVLDLFSYVGSFGIQCSKKGKAKKVLCVEKDRKFTNLAEESAYMNNLRNKDIEFVCSDAITFLENCKELFDIVILDPPNLIPTSKFISSGSQRYLHIIRLATNCISSNGLLLIIFSNKLCSYQDHINIINESFVDSNRTVKIVGQGRGSPDHPANLSLYQFSDFYWFLLQLCP